MYSLIIRFNHPWLLFAIIPFIIFTLVPYFRLSKKYRKTRNRITSMALHGIVSICFVLLLSGMTIVTEKSNTTNEILILVDVSDTTERNGEKRDNLVETIIDYSKFDKFKIGVVTFGNDCEYAVPFTTDYDNIMNQYESSVYPDTTATNIAQALIYSKDLFTYGSNAKIVIVSDFKETDESARSVIKQLVSNGITVDTAYVQSELEEDVEDIEIFNVKYPEYHINKGDICSINVDLYSTTTKDVSVVLTDNGQSDDESVIDVHIVPGTQTVSFSHQFLTDGLHEITFSLQGNGDLIKDNDLYTSYMSVESFNNVLILEQCDTDSILLKEVLEKDEMYNVKVLNVFNDKLPETAKDMCAYDQIILNNIANSDLPEGFDLILYEYVNTYGGGMLTVGGSDDTDEAHAYNRNDLSGTRLQQMLPVQAIEYTPPVGVIIIIDRSGSMDTQTESGSYLQWARSGAASCVKALKERDYVGIMTLESDYNTILELTSRTQESKILSAINSIDVAQGGTSFPGAIERAGQALRSLKQVDKKHIIIVSDGMCGATDYLTYEPDIKDFYETDGITISVVCVDMKKPSNYKELEKESYSYTKLDVSDVYERMLRITKLGHGILHTINETNKSDLVKEMREDLNAKEIKEVIQEPYSPSALSVTSNIVKNIPLENDEEHNNALPFELEGFYGVKARSNAETVLVGEFNVPIYSIWKFGNGFVGSFMSDLNGKWSSQLYSSEYGATFIYNMVNSVSPATLIRSNPISFTIKRENYINTLSVYAGLQKGERIEASIVQFGDEGNPYSLNSVLDDMSFENLRGLFGYTLTSLNEDNNYSRCKFVIKESGAYTIYLKKIDKDGNVVAENKCNFSFAYSKEYDTQNFNEQDAIYNAELLSKMGNGQMVEDIDDPHEVVDSFDTSTFKTYDPRNLLAIIAIVCFLLDIFVRKFKFKWPHEIIKKIRDSRK